MVATPLGPVLVREEDGAIVSLGWGEPAAPLAKGAPDPGPLLAAARAQLAAYFEGRLRRFELPLRPSGTPFQRAVWRALAEIPYGATESYGALARRLGTSPRAVGAACARNPVPVLIPCHRAVGAGGGLGGYSGGGGVEAKRLLLRLEEAAARTAA